MPCARLAWLIPSDAELTGRTVAAREDWLRAALADGYDWWPVLQAHYAAAHTRLWTAEDETRLRTGWREAHPLGELVAQLGASELQIVRRYLQLGFAETMADVASHLGAECGGVIDTRVRLAVDRASAAVWVLTVEGAGSLVAQFSRSRRHISVHPHYDAAADALAEILATSRRDPTGVRYSIVARTLGEHTTGTDVHVTLDSDDAEG